MPIFLYSDTKIINICWNDNDFDKFRVKEAVYKYNYMLGTIFVNVFTNGEYKFGLYSYEQFDSIERKFIKYNIFECKFEHENLEILEERFPWFLQFKDAVQKLKTVISYEDFLEKFREDMYQYILNDKVLYQKAIKRFDCLFSECRSHYIESYKKSL